MNAVFSSRPGSRATDNSGAWTRIWTTFMIAMLIASFFSTFIQPVTAQDLQPLDPQATEATEQPPQEQPAEDPPTGEQPPDGEQPPEGEQPPDGEDTQEIEIQTAAQPGSITIEYKGCSPDADLSDPTIPGGTLNGVCNLAAPPATFTVSQNGTPLQSLNAPPSVTFMAIPPGLTDVTMTPVPAVSAVYCEGFAQSNTKPYARVVGTSSGITLDVLDGEQIRCEWFVHVEAQGGTVTLYKWECELGTMAGQSLEYYQGGLPDQETRPCETEQAGIDFTLTDANGTTPFQSDTNGQQLDNVMPDANGNFTITEAMQEGYGEPFRYCLPLNYAPNGAQPPAWVTGGMGYDITVTVLPGESDYQCWFYNIPEQDYTVTVYKWECPQGTMYGQTDPDYYSGECATEQPGVDFELIDGSGTTPFQSDTNGQQLEGVTLDANGSFTITELPLDGYGDPVRYCQPVDALVNGLGPYPWETPATGASVTVQPPEGMYDWQCWYYNIPYQDSTVTIRKWECPEGVEPTGESTWYQTNCTTPHDGIEFTLTDSMGPRSITTSSGQVQWTDVQDGPISIAETVPPGWDPHLYVVCGWTAMTGGAVVDAFPMPVNTINGVLNTTIQYPGTDYFCDWYNRYLGPGEITAYKYTCPEGYNRNAWGANPLDDCTEGTNGVTFMLDQPDPEIDLQSDTGDSVNGAVYFGGLEPGEYVLREMVPDGTAEVFVWDCVGITYSSVHPRPLSLGPELTIRILGGDRIECYFYNVPEMSPNDGSMLVRKFNCTTPTYVSEVDCYTYEGGQNFDLQQWNGATWTTVQSGTTNAAGQLTFPNLQPGDYRLVEPGTMACLMKSSNITPNNNIGVTAAVQTTVHVYNCSQPAKQPTKPTKYPNTGAPPAEEIRTSHDNALLGLLGLAGVTTVSRRTFLKRAAIGSVMLGGSTVALGRTMASQTLVPLDATVTPDASPAATPTADCIYPATPEPVGGTPESGSAIQEIGSEVTEDATPGTELVCARGAVPVHMTIPAIGVDAEIEHLEIIEGEMEQPSNAEDVAWYKTTARLGERGNAIFAGHLNFWNVPEGVFFLLETMTEGDVVEVEGDDSESYRYIVQWTQDFPIDEEPPEEALGQTDDEVITLITCGGEWNADVALYDHRTLVRAVRDIDYVPGTPAPGGTPPA